MDYGCATTAPASRVLLGPRLRDHGSGLADSPSRLRFTSFTTTAARLIIQAQDIDSLSVICFLLLVARYE